MKMEPNRGKEGTEKVAEKYGKPKEGVAFTIYDHEFVNMMH